MTALRHDLYARVADVPAQDWDALAASASVPMGRAFWALLEDARINDFDYRYLVFRDDSGPAAIAVFYNVTTDIAIFATGALRTALQAVRRVFPGFLMMRMLECGTPVTISSPPYARREDVADEAVIAALDRVMLAVARRERHFMVIVRDFEPEQDGLRACYRRLGYHWIDSLPNTYLPVAWDSFDGYVESMRSYFRSKLRKHRKRNEAAGLGSELQRDFAAMADTLCRQWIVVHENASEFQREVLTPEFYRRLATDLDGRAMVLLFRQHGELIGHALLLHDGDMLRWLYLGRERAANDGLYLYVAQQVVKTAIDLGARRIEMGLTTYDIKQDLGARMTPIHLALRAPSWWIHPFVGLGYAVLNQVPAAGQRQVFQQVS